MADVLGYDMPDELYYHKDHAWARVEEDGSVTVGMNAMFSKNAGDIVSIDLPFEGDDVEQGETCGKLQSAKWIGKLISPVSGEITEVNEELESDSSLINKDPYGSGWIMKINPSNLDEELSSLMQGEALEEWLRGEIERAEREKKK
jgi:glycine cleavage system H protein